MKDRIARVLVGTSLARASDPVVIAATELARSTGAALTIFHAFTSPASVYVAPLGVAAVDPQAIGREGEKRALEVEAQLLGLDLDPAEAEIVVEMGAPHRMLLEVAGSCDADLLVVGGSESHGPLAPLLGSTADRVLRKAPCPVLIVRGDLSEPPKRVLAPVDLSDLAASALGQGVALLEAWSGGTMPRVEALFVLGPMDREGLSFTTEQMDRFAAQALDELVAKALPEGPAVTRTVGVGLPRQTILEHLDEHPVDLVLLSTHGSGGFERLLLGSVAAAVSHRAPTSVLFYPPPR